MKLQLISILGTIQAIAMCTAFSAHAQVAPDLTDEAIRTVNELKSYSSPNLLKEEKDFITQSVSSLEACCSKNDSNYYSTVSYYQKIKTRQETELATKQKTRDEFLLLQARYNAFKDKVYDDRSARFRSWLAAEKSTKDFQADVIYKSLPADEKKLADEFKQMEIDYANTVNTQETLVSEINRMKSDLKRTNEVINENSAIVAKKNSELADIESRFGKIKSENSKKQLLLSNSELDFGTPCADRKYFNIKGFDKNTILVKSVKRDTWGSPYAVYAFLHLDQATGTTTVTTKCRYFPCESDPTPPTYGNMNAVACSMNASCNPKLIELFGDGKTQSKPLVDFNALGNRYLPKFMSEEVSSAKNYFGSTKDQSFFDIWIKMNARPEVKKYNTPETYGPVKDLLDQYFVQIDQEMKKITFDPKLTFAQNNNKVIAAMKKLEQTYKQGAIYKTSKIDPVARDYILEKFFINITNAVDYVQFDPKKGKADPERSHRNIMKSMTEECRTGSASEDAMKILCDKFNTYTSESAALTETVYEFKNEIKTIDPKTKCPSDFISRVDQNYFKQDCDGSCGSSSIQNGNQDLLNPLEKINEKLKQN